jgi:hypothetical protein
MEKISGAALLPDDEDVTPLSTEDAIEMADDILQYREHKCNDWEREFCRSMHWWSSVTLTKKQTKTMNRLYDRVMR